MICKFYKIIFGILNVMILTSMDWLYLFLFQKVHDRRTRVCVLLCSYVLRCDFDERYTPTNISGYSYIAYITIKWFLFRGDGDLHSLPRLVIHLLKMNWLEIHQMVFIDCGENIILIINTIIYKLFVFTS